MLSRVLHKVSAETHLRKKQSSQVSANLCQMLLACLLCLSSGLKLWLEYYTYILQKLLPGFRREFLRGRVVDQGALK